MEKIKIIKNVFKWLKKSKSENHFKKFSYASQVTWIQINQKKKKKNKEKKNPRESPSFIREMKCVRNFNNPPEHSFK